MKRLLFVAALATATVPALAADVGVSVSIGHPGFYGRIDIGGYPQPRFIYPQAVVIERVPGNRPPVYLRVPFEHAKHWGRYCRQYNACGERVFFVQDDWYTREYAPRYQAQHRDRRDERRVERRDDHRGDRRNDRRDDNREHGRE